jgi:hypothetical protein
MELFEMHADFYNKPIRLTKEQCDQPLEVISDFFHGHHLSEIRQILWDWLEVSLTTNNSIFDESSERDRIFWFYKVLEAFIEAVYILHLQNEKSMSHGNTTQSFR